ncbi:hypothetical protein GCM10027275_55060 [Rhabdobacter roseus]
MHKTVEDTLAVISEYATAYAKFENISWAICLKEDPARMIGSMGYYRTDLANFKAEVGYLLHPDHWGKSYVSEALKIVLDYGFNTLGLHKIFANYSPDNGASRQVLLKTGFEREGLLKDNLYFEGVFYDTEICGLIAPIEKNK